MYLVTLKSKFEKFTPGLDFWRLPGSNFQIDISRSPDTYFEASCREKYYGVFSSSLSLLNKKLSVIILSNKLSVIFIPSTLNTLGKLSVIFIIRRQNQSSGSKNRSSGSKINSTRRLNHSSRFKIYSTPPQIMGLISKVYGIPLQSEKCRIQDQQGP